MKATHCWRQTPILREGALIPRVLLLRFAVGSRAPTEAFKKVKCPKCGFVSYPGLAQCKKCGYVPSSAVAQSGRAHPSKFRSVNRPETLVPPLPASSDERPEKPDYLSAFAAPASIGSTPVGGSVPTTKKTPTREPRAAWRDELARRVKLFHGRRAQLREASDPRTNLEFDFNGEGRTALAPEALNQGRETLDFILDDRTGSPSDRGLILDSVSLLEGGLTEGLPPSEAGAEWALQRRESDAPAWSAPEPVEIVLDTVQQEEAPDLTAGMQRRPAGPLGIRFAAGILDGFVLLVALAVFTLIFRESGGRLSARPLDLAVIAFAAASFLLLYFALFTGLAFATPGQSALALQVRTLEGERPNSTDALWRAFGYLVSAAALMLGFVWAVFDGDRLAWHDHMSRTCLVTVDRGTEAG